MKIDFNGETFYRLTFVLLEIFELRNISYLQDILNSIIWTTAVYWYMSNGLYINLSTIVSSSFHLMIFLQCKNALTWRVASLEQDSLVVFYCISTSDLTRGMASDWRGLVRWRLLYMVSIFPSHMLNSEVHISLYDTWHLFILHF